MSLLNAPKSGKNALEKIAVKTELNDTTIMIIIF